MSTYILILFLGVALAENSTFQSFLLEHNKTYRSDEELIRRERIFRTNLRQIEEHNWKFQQGQVSYQLGINQFTDLSPEEFRARLKTQQLDEATLKTMQKHDTRELNVSKLPQRIDWREKRVVTGVKNQGECGSCWAFSATGTLEGQLAIKTGRLLSLSEQELMDCDKHNRGCLGGVVQYAIDYVAKHGLTLEENYPYRKSEGFCNRYQEKVISAKSSVTIAPNEIALKRAVGLIGPISVAVNADQIYFYKSGIFDPVFCSDQVNHGVLIVGYGRDETHGKDYWIIKNSWGTEWGENGYYRMAMGRSLCGITKQACYPIGVTSGSTSLQAGAVMLFLICLYNFLPI